MPSQKYSWSFVSLRSRNGTTAILFSGGLNCDARKRSPLNNQIAAAPRRRQAAPVATNFRFRRTHFLPRVKNPRAPGANGSLLSQVLRVSGRREGGRLRAFWSFSRHLRQIVERS